MVITIVQTIKHQFYTIKSGMQRKFNPKNRGYSSKQPWNILN